jgi:NPCBM/NEW2 domain
MSKKYLGNIYQNMNRGELNDERKTKRTTNGSSNWGGLLSGTAAFAASTAKIEVSFENIKYMFDGVQKASADNAIVYKGQLYAPLKFVANASGKDFMFDGKNKTAWIGKKEGAFKYLSDVNYARIDGTNVSNVDFNQNYDRNKIVIADNKFQKGVAFYLGWNTKQVSIDYNLNGKYKKLSTSLGIDDATKNSLAGMTYRFIGDGTELASFENVKGGDNPKPVTIDLSGVLKLQIVVESVRPEGSYEPTYAALAEPKLFQ